MWLVPSSKLDSMCGDREHLERQSKLVEGMWTLQRQMCAVIFLEYWFKNANYKPQYNLNIDSPM